ncbi:MAG: hypothetical protein CVT99_15495 [Bacteroidetes bacterium HGW-Bacteroidetes-16]|jgi:PAS domain S-box-containing protein|nr:MAG: hypothetical protein CVT99_15495 [Bacteroidetes bacterium HGW-Bacteroidetes-16]
MKKSAVKDHVDKKPKKNQAKTKKVNNSETRYRRLFESAKVGILILDAETGKIVDVNLFLMELLGYSKEEFIEKLIWEIGAFQDIYENKQKFLELQQKEYVRYEDLPLATSDGHEILVEFISNVYLVNNHKVIQCQIRDITARKKTEAALEKTRKELDEIKKSADELNEFTENMIDTVREPLLAIDQDLRVIKASRSFYQFFKVTADETIGKLIYELGNHQWDIPKLRELLEKIIPEKNSFDNYEVEHRFSTIGKRVMLLNARQIKRAFGKEKIILLAIEDITERKGKEDSLKETQRETSGSLNILMDLMHAPIIIWDTSMIIKRFNRKFELLSGYDSDEVIGRKIDFLFPNEKIAATLELLKNHLDNEHEVAEIDILTKDNHIKTVLWNSSRILDEEGKNIIATISQDITSRRQAEMALRKSESHLRTLVNTIPDLIWLKDTNGLYLSCNPMFERFFGASEPEIIGKTDYDFVDRNLADFFRKNDLKAIEAGKPTSNEEWVTFADDGHRAFLDTIKSPIYDSDGTVLGILGIGRDITERKEAEDALLENEIKYRAFFENSMDAIFLTSPDGKTLSANQAACAMFGYSEDELIKLGRSAIVDSSDSRLSVLLDERKLKGKARGEVTLLHKDRTRFPAEISSAIFKNQGGFELTSMIIRDITKRKLTEEALREREQLYRSLFENMLNGFAYCKMIFEEERPQDFIYLAVNNSFEIQTGLKDVIGKKASEVIPGIRKSDPILFELYGRVALTGKPETIEIYVEALKMWFSISVYSPVNEHFVSIFDVITKRKNAEEVLRQSEAKFRNLINSLPDPVLVVDSKGRIVYCNENTVNIFDYNIDEMLNRTMEDLIPKHFRELHKTLRNEYISEPKSRAMGQGKELFAQRKDGSEFPTEIMLEPVEINGNQFTLAIVRDITERKKIQNELKLQANLLNNVGQSVIATDLSGNVIYWNNAAEKMYGWSMAEVIGQNIIILTPTQSTREQAAELMKKLSEGESWTGEFIVKRKDGSSFPALVTDTPILDANGKLTGIIGISSDITERKRAEMELIEAKEKAEESDRLKTAFLNNVSHEIRTPLNAIVGFSGFLNDPDLKPENRQEFIDIILQSSDQLLAIIDDIMSIASVEAGQEKIQEDEVNINLVCNLLKEQFSSKAIEKNVTLNLKSGVSDDEAIVITDATKLTQILNNLVGNALKFTRKGYINYGYKIKDSQLEFYVEDSGIGIDLDMQEIIFDRFRQIETTSTRNFGGSGLGLSISKAYVEMLGGKMWLTSEMGKGSVFYFTIPYKNANPKKLPDIPSVKGLDFEFKSTKTVLIAEDEISNFILLKEMLSNSGITMIRAVNGLEAVKLCQSNPNIDLVLMDIKMPEMDGYEATKRIKEFRPDLPIIAQTAYITEADRIKALACGCSDYISKPISKQLLLSKINEQLHH